MATMYATCIDLAFSATFIHACVPLKADLAPTIPYTRIHRSTAFSPTPQARLMTKPKIVKYHLQQGFRYTCMLLSTRSDATASRLLPRSGCLLDVGFALGHMLPLRSVMLTGFRAQWPPMVLAFEKGDEWKPM